MKRSKRDKTCKYQWINTTCAKPPWDKCSLCSPQWSGMECPVEYSAMMGLFNICSVHTMAPGHMMLLSTWNVVGVTKELNASLPIRVESLSVPQGWVTTLLGSADPDWGGSCCLVYTPGTPIPSVNTSGKWLRGLPRWLSGKESACQCKRHERRGFDPWVKKIPSKRE